MLGLLLLFGAGSDTAVASEPGIRPLVAAFHAREFSVTFHHEPHMPRHVTFTIGETREPIRAQLAHTIQTPDGPAQVPLPLGAATVRMHLKGVVSGVELLNVPCTVVAPAAALPTDEDAGEISIPLSGLGSLTTPDDYQARFDADFGGGAVQVWPTSGHLILTARARFTEA